MEKHSRAVQQCHEGQSQRNMLIGLATKLSNQTPLQEFKRGHVFFAGESDSPIL